MKTKIKILSLEEALDVVEKGKTDYNIVSIRDKEQPSVYKLFDDNRANYNDLIWEEFDDIEAPRRGDNLVKKEQIERLLDWARDKDNLIVHCTAGVSRSSAMAYLIVCMKEGIPEALSILNYIYHCPNRYLIYAGSKILGNDEIYNQFVVWYNDQKEKLEKYL